MRRLLPWLLTALFGLASSVGASAQTWRLLPGGSQSLFGVAELSPEDPFSVTVRSGGNLDVGSMGLGPTCIGFAMARPDVIVLAEDPSAEIDFFVRANGGDTTLIVHTPDGRWLCDDDGGGGNNPRVHIESPATGQYDVWVGSYRPDQHLRATLRVTSGQSS